MTNSFSISEDKLLYERKAIELQNIGLLRIEYKTQENCFVVGEGWLVKSTQQLPLKQEAVILTSHSFLLKERVEWMRSPEMKSYYFYWRK